MNFYFGTDPEFFLVDKNGYCVPPVILRQQYNVATLGFADKNDEEEKRHFIFYRDNNITIHEDGSAFELITRPLESLSFVKNYMTQAVYVMNNLLDKYRIPNLSVSNKVTVPFNNEILFINGIIDTYRQWCCRFGCDKDLNIYDKNYSKDIDASKINSRFAGGHIHFSPVPHKFAYPFTQLCEIFVGNTCTAFTTDITGEVKRRKYYGMPGKIRLQKYSNGLEGVEYRPPSNNWIMNQTTINILDVATKKLMIIFSDPDNAIKLIDKYFNDAINNIVNCDISSAKSLFSKLKIL